MAEPGGLDATAAIGWIGGPLSDLEGERLGDVEGLYIDAKNHRPAWVVARLSPTRRRDRGRVVAIPAGVCAGAPGVGVWIAEDGEMLRSAPVVDPGRALLREHELTILGHYGIAGDVGRAGEIAERDDGDVTAIPRAADTATLRLSFVALWATKDNRRALLLRKERVESSS